MLKMASIPFRFLLLSVLLPNSCCSWLSSSKVMPISFSSSSRTFLISAPSTRACPQFVTRIWKTPSSSSEENFFFFNGWMGLLRCVVVASSLLAAKASAMSSSSSKSSSGAAVTANAKKKMIATTWCVLNETLPHQNESFTTKPSLKSHYVEMFS